MAAKVVDDVKMLGEWRVSPPAGSVPPTELRLSFFDVALISVQVEYLLFFDFQLGSTQDFRDEHFPILRRSLSLALSLFYPVAGRLVKFPSPDSNYPVIRYSEGDFVTLTLAESGADFACLVGNQAKEAKAFHPLVPQLDAVNIITFVSAVPMMAFQVTIFPGSGVSIGLKFNHVVADGFAVIHFLKSWAAISKAGGTIDVSVVRGPPVFDRALLGAIQEQMLKRPLLDDQVTAENGGRHEPPQDDPSLTESPDDEELNQKPRPHRMTRATFVLKRTHMETLRRKMVQHLSCFRTDYNHSDQVGPLSISTFAATCAFVWACLAKSRTVGPTTGDLRGPTLYFWIPANFRPRLRPPVPSSYFGNVSPVSAVVEVSHAELTGDLNGLASAAKAIQLAIRGMMDERMLERLPSVNRRLVEVMVSKPRERRFSIAGSPMFRAYDIDFGWGRPRKIEFPSTETTELVSFSDSRDEEGGIEIGLGGPEDEISRFGSLFKEGLKGLCCHSKL